MHQKMTCASMLNRLLFSSFIYCLSCTLVFAQNAALLPNALQVYFDANGNPLSSGTVTFYYPSTSNLKPIWQDANEVTPYTNPVTLNAAGRPPGSAGVYGQGSYRQLVKDSLGNVIWDAVTSSAGSASTVTGTGDGDLVGTVKPWAGIAAPNQYQFAYGQQVSRITFASLFTAITQSLNVVCANASNTLTGISDTTSINIGSAIEVASCVVPGTTVSSKTSSTVVMSNPSTVNLNSTAIFFPFGNGDGSTTFTLPDFRGNVIAGRPNMGGTASTNLTNTFCANPTAQGAICGAQSATLARANLPNVAPTFSGTPQTVTSNESNILENKAGATQVSAGSGILINAGTASVTFTPGGNIQSLNGNVTQTAFSLVQPTITLNYIIKVTADTNSAIATGVTDIQGMVGSIACGAGLICSGNIISSSNGVTLPTIIGNVAIFRNIIGGLTDGGTAIRQRVNNLTLYVDPNGISTTCLAPGVSTACTSNQVMTNIANLYDVQGTITIQFADGTYTNLPFIAQPYVGSGNITLQGNTITPANVLITCNVACGTNGGNGLLDFEGVGGNWFIQGFKLTSSFAGNNGLVVNSVPLTRITFNALDFGAFTGTSSHITCVDGSLIDQGGNFAISGGATNHLSVTNNCVVHERTGTVTITNTPTFTIFAKAHNLGIIGITASIFSGSVNAGTQQCSSDGGSLIDSTGTFASLPGGVACSVSGSNGGFVN